MKDLIIQIVGLLATLAFLLGLLSLIAPPDSILGAKVTEHNSGLQGLSDSGERLGYLEACKEIAYKILTDPAVSQEEKTRVLKHVWHVSDSVIAEVNRTIEKEVAK